MAIFKCKMCGGDLDITEGVSVCECEYCGTRQTVPTADNEKKMTLFARANRLRAANEFDKAAGIYESIAAEFPEEAEAYWGLVLCKYGIEYVDDPATGKKVPTCHRSSFDSVMEDVDFEQACENADGMARRQYREEAKQIEEIRKGIIEVSGKEAPYDIFICYKETDESGDRTIDSVIAQDVYDALTSKGYRVFFSRISLEDKLGTEYEPYIFAALNSAKVMLAFGTDFEYYNAVWVKNEWSRFLKLMEKDKTKHLIPCYKDIDAYDMPKEFRRLQAQDMGKVGAIQDLVRGIEKLIPKDRFNNTEKPVSASVAAGVATIQSLLKRVNLFLEEGDWGKAEAYAEKILDIDPECAEAYLGKLLAMNHQSDWLALTGIYTNKFADGVTEKLEACPADEHHIEEMVKEYTIKGFVEPDAIRTMYAFDRFYNAKLPCRIKQKETCQKEIKDNRLLSRARQYAVGDLKKKIEDGITIVEEILDYRIAEAREEDRVNTERVKTEYKAHIAEADKRVHELNSKGQNLREQQYQKALSSMYTASDLASYRKTRDELKALYGYKDSSELAGKCQEKIDQFSKEHYVSIGEYYKKLEELNDLKPDDSEYIARISEIEHKKSNLTERLSSLKFFNYKEKKRISEEIANCEKELKEVQSELQEVRKKFYAAIAEQREVYIKKIKDYNGAFN